MARKEIHPKGKDALAEIRRIAAIYGLATTRWAVRRWDKNMAEKKKLLKMKKNLEAELSAISKRLK